MGELFEIPDTPAEILSQFIKPSPGAATPDHARDSERDDSSSGWSEEEEDDRNILRPTTQALGLSRYYVQDWTPQDAFRELYQNWKDAILVSFQLDPRSFKPEKRDLTNEVQILVHHPTAIQTGTNRRELLGYIRYKKRPGSVELTNFKAQLTRQNLELGGTTKRGNGTLAGVHGEGLKIAALVLRRNEHRVRLVSSSYYWNFGFRGINRSNFYCKLSAAKPETIIKRRLAYETRRAQGSPRGLTANIWEDVSVVVGKGRGEFGQRVSEDAFKSWIQVSLDIEGPKDSAHIVQTDHGDLLLDPEFAGKIYLKGLLLPNAGSAANKFRFGYNLLRGQTNRDRQRLTDPVEEAEVLMSIWEHAIQIRGVDILQRFIDLLQNYHTYADVNMAEDTISKITASAIWNHLLQAGTGQFFYCQTNGDSDCDIIRKSLKRQPVPLSEKLWKILRRFSLARTPQEQRVYLFTNSQPSSLQPTVFSDNVKRGLMASLALHPKTQDVTVEFVNGAGTDIDLLFSHEEKRLKVHEKWLDFDKIHEMAPCEVSQLAAVHGSRSNTFFCDHIVEELHELAVDRIIETLILDQSEAITVRRSLRHEVREKLRQMPRMITIACTEQPHELVVSWTDGESELIRELYGSSITYCVVLHRERICSQKRTELLHQNDLGENSGEIDKKIAPCGCQQVMVSQTARRAVFSGLRFFEPYFAMVARTERHSFFGFPSKAINPKPYPNRPGIDLLRSNPFDSTQQEYMYSSDEDDAGMLQNEVTRQERAQSRDLPAPQQARTPTSTTAPVVGASATDPGMAQGLPDRTLRTGQAQTNFQQWQQQQDRMWDSWERDSLKAAFDQFFSERILPPTDLPSISSLACQRLNYLFVKNEYVQIRMQPPSGMGDEMECVAFIHNILRIEPEDGIKSFALVVSRYSFLQSTPPFSSKQHSANTAISINRKELLLHFGDFETMGERQDAEIIFVDDILQAQDLEFTPAGPQDPVQHLTRVPENLDDCGFFCRFAIRGRIGDESACISPIGSNLLSHRDRWKLPRYTPSSRPAVIDLSPSVLGLSEGFLQEGYEICAGLGFDPAFNMSWKARYPSAVVYDGSPAIVLSQITSGQLAPPPSLGPEVPKVVLVAGQISRFILTEKCHEHPSLRLFLQPVETIKALIENLAHASDSFDFLVWTMPCAILHPQALPGFLQTIHLLLERRYSIHINKVHLPSYGFPHDITYIVLLASPVCSAPRSVWGEFTQKTVNDVIGDLSFRNTRVDNNHKRAGAFVCIKPSNPTSPESRNGLTSTIYNHNTGQPPLQGTQQVDFNSTALKIAANHPFGILNLLHPTRGDLLTVRELARIHGFPDDFIFYHHESVQYSQLTKAFPPPIARVVAKGIWKVIEEFRGTELSMATPEGDMMSPRGSKRPRVAT